jgi:dTDP-4-amino-4,6-dideoxygalactose transaminase
MRKIRHRPSYPLLALMARRIRRYRPEAIERRIANASRADALLQNVDRPGRRADFHSHWVFPVLVPNPGALAERLWRAGFDATRGRWSLYVVQAPAGRPDARARQANEVMSRLLYLPVYPAVPASEGARLARLVEEGAGTLEGVVT